jgi:hypothetical protein
MDPEPAETINVEALRHQAHSAAPDADHLPGAAVDAAGPRTAGPGRLVFIHPLGQLVGRAYPIGPGPAVVGRDPGCDVVCPDESVSRRHARVEPRPDGKHQVSDLGSTNGVRVNQVRVRSAVLRDGDYLQLGLCVYRFLAGENSEAEYREEVRRLADLVAAMTPPPGGR